MATKRASSGRMQVESLSFRKCRGILGSFSVVVRDLKDRMAVEIGREDLQAAFVAFDLGAWSRAFARAQGTHVDASMLDARYSRTELCSAAQRLCKAFLGIEDGEVRDEWRRMVQRALEVRESMRIGPRRAPSEFVRTAAWDVADPHPIDNRMVWRLVLDDGGVPDRLRNLVLAYFACLHGTGCVERGLGLDKRAVVEPHVGSLRPSAEVEEENSSCLELHREGPRREQDLFVPSAECGVLLLTDFSRACATRWLEVHGRRFGANTKVRRDEKVAEKRALGQHTDAALRRGVRSCYAQIAQEANLARSASRRAAAGASTPTILGEHRKDLVKRIGEMQEHETITKGTKKYRNFTKTKAMEKEKKRATAGVWAGWALDRPVMRLGGAAAVHAASSSAAAHGAQARRWLGRTCKSPGQVKAAKTTLVPRCPAPPLDGAIPGQVKAAQGTQVPRRPAAPLEEARPKSVGGVLPRRPALRTMRSESALAVKSKLGDGTSADDLRRWIVAVAYGKPVLVDSGRGPVERCRLKPALGRVYNIRFTQKFASRHPELEKLTSEIAECDGSKWRVWSCGSPGAPRRNAVEIDSSASFVHLLRSMMVRG